jgi:hypothetical protein
MFGIEILLALLLKFWTILYGLVFGTISSLPALHRSLLSRQLRVDWYEADSLILQSMGRDVHLTGLSVVAMHAGKAVIVHQARDAMLCSGQTLRIPVDAQAETLVLTGDMLDLSNGRQTRLFRRIEREHGILPQ